MGRADQGDICVPIGEVSARYVRSYIEAGEAAAGRPMGLAECAIIDTFEAVTKRPGLMLEFTLQPGEDHLVGSKCPSTATTTKCGIRSFKGLMAAAHADG